MAAKQKPILYKGMGQPYLALFNFGGMPIMNPITGIPLGAYISTWSYKYDEEKENLATITFDTGNPDTVDCRKHSIWNWFYIIDIISSSNTCS